MTETGDDLPVGWVGTTFSEVAEHRLGKMLDKRKNTGTPRPYLRNINVRWHGFDLGDVREMRIEDAEMDKYTVQKGDLVICEGGEPGRAAVWRREEPFAYQKALHRARPRGGVEADYLLFMLEDAAGTGRLAEHFTGSTINHLTGRELAKVRVPLPPLAEQRRIVDALEAAFADLDAGVVAIEAAERGLERYRRSVLKAAVEGALTADWRRQHSEAEPAAVLLARVAEERRTQWEADQLAKYEAKGKTPPKNWRQRYKPPVVPEREGLSGLPEGWAWASLDGLAALEPRSITDGPFGSNLKTSHYTDSGPRVIRLQNVGDGEFIDVYAHISQEHFETLEKHHVQAGDLVIASLGEELPRACVIPASVGPALVKADCIRFKPNDDAVLTSYALFALNSSPTRRRTTDSIHGVGRPRLNLGKLRAVALPVPPLAEQAAIVEAVEERLSVAAAAAAELDRQLSRADRLRKAVLKRAFAGELVPQDPTDEPASVLLERVQKELAERKKTTTPRKRKRTMSTPKPTPPGSLFEIVEAEGPIEPQDLWTKSKDLWKTPEGDHSVDAFYAALRVEVTEKKRLAEERPSDTQRLIILA